MENTNSKIFDVAVIGGGAAGVMATIRTVLNNDDTILFPGTAKDKKRSRAFWVSKVENIPAHLNYKKGIEDPNRQSLEWLSSGHFQDKFNWMKNIGILSVKKNVDGIFELLASNQELYFSKFVILCTGVMDVQPEINGSIKPILPFANIQDIDYCLRCDGHHVLGKDLAVIGHESGAAWAAVMLHERYFLGTKRLTFILTNGKEANFDKDVDDLLKVYGIKVFTSPITAVMGKENLTGFLLGNGEEVSVQISFVSLGMIIYNEIARQLGADLDSRGFVLANEHGLTNVDGLYVAGDLKANTKKQIYTSWDTAVNSADQVNMRLRKEKRLKEINK